MFAIFTFLDEETNMAIKVNKQNINFKKYNYQDNFNF